MTFRALSPLAALLILVAQGAATAGLSAEEQRMADWIDEHAEDAISLLAETVNIGSGTMNHEGVREVGRVMRRELDTLGLETEWIEMPPEVNRAGHLFGRKDGRGKKILLIGHLDTVFASDDAFQSFERDGDTASGPGVDDMKSGNIILIEAGQWADISLGFESAVTYDDTDWATIARRSSSSWTLEVEGRQAHSSGIFGDEVGAGAIFEAARILDAFYQEVRGEEYLTFNAGTIVGGTDVEYDGQQNRGTTFGKTNVVPRKVIVHGGMRTISIEQLERAREKMRVVVENNLPHTSATIKFRDSYPPMSPTEGNARLQARFSEINEALGRGPMPALDPLKRGAADISFVAPYTDGLAGLGALGTGGHTPNENLDLTSIPLAIKRAAILIYRLGAEPQP